MVDNVDFTPGTGATGATDDVGGVHYPRVKISDGTADSSTHLAVVAEDAAASSGVTGLVPMAVQTASPANTAADGDYAWLQANGGHLWVAEPPMVKASANFTCPNNTSHVANDNISDNSTAGSVTKMSFTMSRSAGTIRRVKVRKSDQTVATPTIRVWFWDATFTVGSGDDAAFAQPLQDAIGYADVAVTNAGSDDAIGWTSCDIPFAAGTVYCLLQTLTTFTVGASEVFTVEIHYTPGA